MAILVGVVLEILDNGLNCTSDSDSNPVTVLQYLKATGVSVYHTMAIFTGVASPEPIRVHSRVLTFFVSFSFMVIGAAYTCVAVDSGVNTW